jgi:hypothetical protein
MPVCGGRADRILPGQHHTRPSDSSFAMFHPPRFPRQLTAVGLGLLCLARATPGIAAEPPPLQIEDLYRTDSVVDPITLPEERGLLPAAGRCTNPDDETIAVARG